MRHMSALFCPEFSGFSGDIFSSAREHYIRTAHRYSSGQGIAIYGNIVGNAGKRQKETFKFVITVGSFAGDFQIKIDLAGGGSVEQFVVPTWRSISSCVVWR